MESVRWTPVPECDLGNAHATDSSQGLIGGEVRRIDGHRLEVGMAVEAEEPNRLLRRGA